jgi:uncharacterized protein YukE
MKNLITISMLLISFSCANPIKKAVSDVKYSTYELVGVEKRDLFKKEVANVKEDQEETGESFKDALTKLKELYAFEGGDLEEKHEELNASYLDAKEKSENVKKRIVKLDTVATDLFSEWKGEIHEISSKDLQKQSRAKLSETKKKYHELHKQLKVSESKVDPVLTKLKDQELFLKHNLNAKAIAGLKVESNKIQSEIQGLIDEMNESNKKAEEFIKTL